MAKVIKAGITGAVILFVWGAISWMFLPWHMATIHNFTVEKAVTQSIQSNAPHSGIYLTPTMSHQETSEAVKTKMQEPMVFVAVTLQGMQAMPMPIRMVISFLTQLVAALLVAWMLLRAQGLSYVGRVAFVVVFALAAGTVTEVPYWNWFGFDLQYTLVQFADLLIGWFLAGLALAKICKK